MAQPLTQAEILAVLSAVRPATVTMAVHAGRGVDEVDTLLARLLSAERKLVAMLEPAAAPIPMDEAPGIWVEAFGR